jgi:lysophospholipase L1-like esterase
MKSILLSVGSVLLLTTGLSVAKPLDTAKYSGPIRVACVGDSITAGSGATHGFSYPDQLQKLLGDHWQVHNFGLSGRTLMRSGDHSYWREKAFGKAVDFKPDAVVIMLGTNDTKPQNWAHKEQFYKDYADFVKTFLQSPSKPVIYVCYPPPVPAPGNYGINEAGVDQEMPLIKKVADKYHLDVIDMHAALLDHADSMPDHVHPNNQGAGIMAKTVANALTGQTY